MPDTHENDYPSDFQFGTVTDQQLVNLAIHAGVLGKGPMPPELQEYTLLVMEKCAGIGAKYQRSKHRHTAGDEIRTLFGL